MKTIHVTIANKVLLRLIDTYKSADPIEHPHCFALLLALRELKRFRDAGLTPEEVARIVAERDAAKMQLSEALEDMRLIAGQSNTPHLCNCCQYNPDGMGCILDGSQFDDAGECHFEWCSRKAVEK